MKIITLSIPLNVILVSLLVINLAQSEQPSTVFVLETSDSDSLVSSNNHNNNNNKNNNHKAESPQLASSSSAANAKLKTADDSIIIDDSSVQPNNNDKKNQRNQNQPSQQLKSTTGQADRLNQERQFKQNQSQNQQQTTPSSVHERSLNDDANRHRDSAAASRRLEEESNLTPIVHKITGNHNQSAQKQVNQQKQYKPSSTTTTTASPYVDEHNTHGAKSEERLLISITSDDDETQSHKVSSNGNGGSSNSGTGSEDAQQSSSLLQPNRNQKRKPSITISIQDANINKQGSGSSAVIVRPSEDGHSIVIATVASPNGANGGNSNKFKPIITSTNDNINSPAISNNQQPYRDPINNPIQNIVQQHQIASTTRRPSLVNDYNNPPPINANTNPINLGQSDEQPQRPTQPSFDEPVSSYETPRPRPKPSGSFSGSGHNDNNDNNNNNNGGSSSSSSSSSSPHSGGSYDPETNDQSGSGVNSEPKYPLNEKNCGLLHETRIVGGEEANPDNFMWMAAIIKSRPKDGDPRPFCGGSLITRRHVLTAAHCLDGLAPRDVLVRLSSYDFDDTASSSSSDYAIDQFRVPAQYSKKTHVADIAIMRLKTPIQLTDNYKSVCMPQPRRSYVGALGTVTGYGSNSQTFRRASPKLRQVTVPIWENRKCSIVYKRNLTESFLCAGYEEGGKDACQGDSGGPLMTEGPEQKMMIVGVVSHGIGCGSPGYPGVYTRVSTYMEWIEKNTKE